MYVYICDKTYVCACLATDLDVSHDGRWLISGSFDKTVRIWGVDD